MATLSEQAPELGHLVHGFNGSQVLCQCREGGWLTRLEYAAHVAEKVTAPLTARLAKAWDEGNHAGALGEHQWDPIPNPYRAALASDPTHAQDGGA